MNWDSFNYQKGDCDEYRDSVSTSRETLVSIEIVWVPRRSL